MRIRPSGEHGAGVISLLATVAALALLAALAIPALTKSGASSSQNSGQSAGAVAQAQDQQAQSLLATAQTAVATVAANSTDGYAGLTPGALSAVEPTVITASTTQAYLASASGTQTGYTLVAIEPDTHATFTLTDDNGSTTRTCTPAGQNGCSASGTF